MNPNDLAAAIYHTSHITGIFQLRSGATATEYFDKYQFESDPELLRAIAKAMQPLIPPGTDVLAGLELGGVPLATMVSQITGLPVYFVRKTAKTYGTCRLAEGGEIAGKHLLIIEDVVTSGGQVILSTEDLRNLGAEVTDALCVIDREAGGPEKLAEVGVRLQALYTMSALKEAGEKGA